MAKEINRYPIYEQNMNRDWAILIDHFHKKLEEVFQGMFVIEKIEFEEGGERFRAFSIENRSGKNILDVLNIFFVDWDDTSEKYSARKEKFHEKMVVLFDRFHIDKNFFSLLNRVCRVYPKTGTKPRKYSAYLEVVAISAFYSFLKEDQPPNFLSNFVNDPSEVSARKFVEGVVKNLGLEFIVDDESALFEKGDNLLRFLELENGNINVHQQIFKDFVEIMTVADKTGKLLEPLTSLEQKKIDKNSYWVINTFGELDFQLEKILNSLLFRKEKGLRIPDKIVIYLEGRKEKILEKIIRDIQDKVSGAGKPSKLFEIIDDSLGQIEIFIKSDFFGGLLEENLLKIYRVIISGAKRSVQKLPDDSKKFVEEIYL